jgi:hypothetical protein
MVVVLGRGGFLSKGLLELHREMEAPSRRHRTSDRGTRRTADDHRPGEAPAARPERIELDECG